MRKGFKQYFVPHPGNDHRPHLWRGTSLLVFGLLILLAEGALFGLGGTSSPGMSWEKNFLSADVLPSVLVSLTNTTRQEEHLSVLSVNSHLAQAASLKAQDMAEKGYFSHVTPDGKTPWYWLDQAGYDYQRAGENLAVDFVDSQDVVDAWMRSPSHRANILKQSYTEIGTATATGIYNGKSAVFAVEFFGTPAEAEVAVLPASAGSALPKKTSPNTGTVAIAGAPAGDGGEVAGAEITKAPADTDAPSATIVSRAVASPRHTSLYLLAGILVLFLAGMAVLLGVPGRAAKHPRLVFIGSLAILAVIGIMVFNIHFFTRTVVLPADGLSVIQTPASETR